MTVCAANVELLGPLWKKSFEIFMTSLLLRGHNSFKREMYCVRAASPSLPGDSFWMNLSSDF